MSSVGISRADQNRLIRKEALRDTLESQSHVRYVVDIIEKLEDLPTELDALEIQRLRVAADKRMDLIGKYLPTLKQSDNTLNVTATLQNASDSEIDARISQLLAARG